MIINVVYDDCYCREQLLHKLKLEEKEHEERLEREKSKKLAEFEVRRRGKREWVRRGKRWGGERGVGEKEKEEGKEEGRLED